jgi:hypothetical protein
MEGWAHKPREVTDEKWENRGIFNTTEYSKEAGCHA